MLVKLWRLIKISCENMGWNIDFNQEIIKKDKLILLFMKFEKLNQ